MSLCQAQQATSVPTPAPYTIVSRDANSRVWERTTYELSKSGQTISHKHHYTELASGLCYQQNGQWLDSKEEINILPDGTASATNGQNQVYFPNDIYNGVITHITPDGLHLQSQPVGLCYFDGTNTVLIAELTNSVGELVDSNQVVYPDAFTGFRADLRYTYTKGGFEQDIILQDQPPTPEACGLNPSTTRLQILTEFFNPPQPTITTASLPSQAGVALTDKTLSFGAMKMGPGRAFLLGANGRDEGARVGKNWELIDGRQFLVEEVPVEALADALSILPMAQTVSTTSKQGKMLQMTSHKFQLPAKRIAKIDTNKRFIREATFLRKTGLVLDYQTVTGTPTGFTFQGDTTYYVSRTFVVYGTNIFEGGSVIKYAKTNAEIILEGSPSYNNPVFNLKTSTYNPVILTAVDDNSVGESISGSTGNPSGYYGNGYINVGVGGSGTNFTFLFSNFRFNYANQAINAGESYTITLYDDQFANCKSALFCIQNGFSPGFYLVQARNVLFANIQTNFIGGAPIIVDIQNATFVGVTNLIGFTIHGFGSSPTNTFTNCIFANVVSITNISGLTVRGGYNGFYNSPNFGANTFLTSSYPFQAVGSGNYYLASGSGFQGVGTLNIDSVLAEDLQEKTTYPPIVYSNIVITTPTVFAPQAQRNTGTPDLGYHYDPLDYLFSGCDLYSNLTFTAGTAVGWFYSVDQAAGVPDAITLNDGANLEFDGNATEPCIFVRNSMLQEGGSLNGFDDTQWESGAVTFDGSGTPNLEPQLSAFFSKWTSDDQATLLRDEGHGEGGFINCELYNGQLSTYNVQSLYFTNCLFFRTALSFWDQNYAISFSFENCTFYNGGMVMGRYNCDPFCDSGLSSSFWLIENTAFDGTAFDWYDTLNGNPTNTLFNYNSYNTNNLSWTSYPYFSSVGTNEIVGPNDRMVTNYNWQSSWFGSFYLSTNSPLINKGSTNANFVGLYHFSTQTNQIPEGTNIVDIGYHYVATDNNGNPLDSNGDGLPDYLSDANGNGIADPGEIPWNTGNLNLNVIITRPSNGSTLP